MKLKSLILIILIILPFFALAETFSLSPPGFTEGETSDFLDLLAWLLKGLFFTIGISALLMIIVGGVQYIAAGAMGNPSDIKDAQNRIIMAIGGVLLALGSWIILHTINPDLLKLELNLKEIKSNSQQDQSNNEDQKKSNVFCEDFKEDKAGCETKGYNCGFENGKCVSKSNEEYSWQKDNCSLGFSPGGPGKCSALGNPPGDGFVCCKKNKKL